MHSIDRELQINANVKTNDRRHLLVARDPIVRTGSARKHNISWRSNSITNAMLKPSLPISLAFLSLIILSVANESATSDLVHAVLKDDAALIRAAVANGAEARAPPCP